MARRPPSPDIDRRVSDRRVQAIYHEPDRRERERRAHWPKPKQREQRNWWPLLVAIPVALVLVDALAWHGYYFTQAKVALNRSASESRTFADDMWK